MSIPCAAMSTRACASWKQGEYDAIILAAAGLMRLGKTQFIREYLPEEFMCPAAGQGALGIEIRDGDAADTSASGVLERCATPRRDYLRARAAEQVGRRMPGSDWRLRRGERRNVCI